MSRILRDELVNDPLNRGYSGMSDVQAAKDLNTQYCTRHVNSLTGDQCFAAADSTEFANLSDHEQSLWLAFCARASIDPWAQANEDFVTSLFGGGSNTLGNLAGLRTEPCTRAEELGLGDVDWRDVRHERRFI